MRMIFIASEEYASNAQLLLSRRKVDIMLRRPGYK